MRQSLAIGSIEEAFAFLAQYSESREDVPDVSIVGNWAKFSAHIDGAQFNATIPGELARGLWEYQEALYRAVTFAIYGVEDIRKLTSDQRIDFQLVFKVSEGSTDIWALLTTFLGKLAEGITSMDSKDKALTIVTVAIIIAVCYGGVALIENQTEVKKDEIKAQIAISSEQEKSKQFQIFSDFAKESQIASRFNKAGEEGSKAIVKGSLGAREVNIGKLKFSQDDIDEIKQRAAKDKAAAELIVDEFIIYRVEFRDKTSTKFYLTMKDGSEFQLSVSDEDADADTIQKLLNAAKSRTKIKLEINATIMRGQIKSALLVNVM